MKLFAAVLLSIGFTVPACAEEGMWTLDNPPLKAMRRDIGWAPNAQWLDKAMRSSARFAGGCSGSFVSKNGLVLTNHHCVATCVEQLSSKEQDYLKAGFLARQTTDEKQCPAMEINRLEKITDVTAEIKAATAKLSGTAFKLAQNAAEAKITSACVGTEGSKVRCDVVDLYRGGQYKLYRYHRFQDVRLAFAPEAAIAFFGGDPDNFNFPRFDLDMALVRVYEGGKPSEAGDFFRFSAQGPTADEPVFVTGHPGRTERELTVAQLEFVRDVSLLDRLLNTAEYRGILTQYRSAGGEAERVATRTLFNTENTYKVQRGQLIALGDVEHFQHKRNEEAALRKFVAAKPGLAKTTLGSWDAIARATKIHRNMYDAMVLIENARGFQSRDFVIAQTLVSAAAERPKANADRLPEFNDNKLPEVEARLFSAAPIYPEFETLKAIYGLTKLRERLGVDSPFVKKVLGDKSPQQMADSLVAGTNLADREVRRELWNGGAAAIAKNTDPFIRLAVAIDGDARELRTRYERDVYSVIQKNSELIAHSRFAMTGDGIYPDATFTLRLSYGRIKGWENAGMVVAPFTNLGGAFERATGAEPYALPASWLGSKGKLNLATHFNQSSTQDIIGGNSGSPMINRQGEIVGLVFDGNIHSLSGAYWYDKALNRTVSVNSAGMLEALDKIYGAKALVGELRGL